MARRYAAYFWFLHAEKGGILTDASSGSCEEESRRKVRELALCVCDPSREYLQRWWEYVAGHHHAEFSRRRITSDSSDRGYLKSDFSTLETVARENLPLLKVLLRFGGSSATERNFQGDEVLLVAMIYRRTKILRWLSETYGRKFLAREGALVHSQTTSDSLIALLLRDPDSDPDLGWNEPCGLSRSSNKWEACLAAVVEKCSRSVVRKRLVHLGAIVNEERAFRIAAARRKKDILIWLLERVHIMHPEVAAEIINTSRTEAICNGDVRILESIWNVGMKNHQDWPSMAGWLAPAAARGDTYSVRRILSTDGLGDDAAVKRMAENFEQGRIAPERLSERNFLAFIYYRLCYYWDCKAFRFRHKLERRRIGPCPELQEITPFDLSAEVRECLAMNPQALRLAKPYDSHFKAVTCSVN